MQTRVPKLDIKLKVWYNFKMIENQIQLADQERIGTVLDDASVHLDAEQVLILPYLAHGMSVPQAAALVGVKDRDVRAWKEQPSFEIALARLSGVISGWHASQVQLLALRAWQVLWDILGQDYAELDDRDKSEMAKTARFIVQSIAPDHSTRHVVHEVVSPELNVSDGTIDVLARRLKELEDGPKDAVEGEYKLEELPAVFVCHPDTDIMVVNHDEATGKFQCHVCGEWFSEFIQHVEGAHAMTRSQYVDVFKLEDAIIKW